MDVTVILDAIPLLIEQGLRLTLELLFLSLAVGLVFAVLIALMRLSGIPGVAHVAYAFVYFFRSTPLLVQFFLIYYGLGQFRPELQAVGLWQFFREPFWCAITALTFNTAAYTSEMIRGGIQSVPHGQIEAARACGMSRVTVFRRIVLPLAIRQALPAYSNEVVLMLHATALASTITLMEMTGLAGRIASRTFDPVSAYVAVGLIYLVITLLLTRGLKWIEWKSTAYLRPRDG